VTESPGDKIATASAKIPFAYQRSGKL